MKRTGLMEAERIYKERFRAPRESLDRSIDYLCAYSPPELMYAAGMTPRRILGNPRESITEADKHLENIMCPYVRNCFDQALKHPELRSAGLVMSHTCDSVYRVAGLWDYHTSPAYFQIINVPHKSSDAALEFFKNELIFFKEKLEAFSGQKVTNEKLIESINLYNKIRNLVRSIYEFRKEDPPRLSGTEMLHLLVSGCRTTPTKYYEILKSAYDEILGRSISENASKPRVMVYGCIIDDEFVYQLIEDSDAHVVIDDTCIGTRIYSNDVEMSEDPMDGLAKSYFSDFVCPRTVKTTDVSRFDYIKGYIQLFKVDGVILYAMDFCDPHKFDIPSIRDYLHENGTPTLYIENNYNLANYGAMKTRIQAFIELLN